MVNRSTIPHKEDLLPLSSGQHWYLNVWQPVNPHYRNLVSLLSVPPALDPILLKRTLQYLLQYHDALRLRFVQGELGWYQYLLQSDDNIPFTYINLTAVSVDQREKNLEELASEQQASLNLFLGPIFKLVYFDFGKSTHGRLLFIIHHLITDALSQTIFLHDFRTAYLQLYSGKDIHLPSKTASFTTWTKRLDAYAQSGELKGEIDNYWLILPWNKVVPLPVDYPGNIQSCTMSSNRLIQIALNVEETIDLLKHSLSARLPMQVGLLAGLALTFADWTGSPLLQVGVMNHGRTLLHDLKLTRTMGFIALAGELLLDIRDTHTLYDVLSRVKEQLQGVPNYGFGYELLTRLCRDTEANKKMHIIPPRQLLFNYMGHKKDTSTQSDFFQSAHENTGPNIDPQEKRKNVDLYCKVIIIDNQLCVTWEYSKDVHRSSTIEAVAQNYLATLRKIAGFLARMYLQARRGGQVSDTVTVITLTRKRSELLRRAILSVQCQDYTGLLQHLILIDECPQTKLLLEMLTLPKNVDWHYLPRETGERSGPKRSAWLRNYGAQVSDTQWISFLDDDNEFEYNHISSLVACAEETCCLAVHSQRKLYNADGTPYLEQRMPWGHGEEIGYQMYKNLQAQGIIQPGSNIMHDKFMPTHCHTDGTPVVDTGEWLLARELLKQYPLSTDYSLEDWNNSVYEDVKLQLCLSKLAIPVASTEQPTLKYYLGGYSNTPGRDRVPGIWAPFD